MVPSPKCGSHECPGARLLVDSVGVWSEEAAVLIWGSLQKVTEVEARMGDRSGEYVPSGGTPHLGPACFSFSEPAELMGWSFFVERRSLLGEGVSLASQSPTSRSGLSAGREMVSGLLRRLMTLLRPLS